MNELLLPSTSSAAVTAGTTATAMTSTVNPSSTTGKTLQLPIVASTCKNSDASCSNSSNSKLTANITNSSLLHCCTKRSHHSSNISSAKSTNINSNFHHPMDANCKTPLQQPYITTTNQSTIKIVSNFRSCPFNRVDDAIKTNERTRKMCVTSSQAMSNAPKTGCSIKKESLSCDSISKATISACAERAEYIVGELDDNVASKKDASPIFEHQNASLLSVNSGASACGSSGSSCGGNNLSSTSTITASNSPMILLSKSETNIFEGIDGDDGNKLSVFSVVSLNDLNECDPFLNRPMNDLSKTQCLNQISDERCRMNDNMRQHALIVNSKKTITSPTVTVTMRNSDDFSDF